MCEGNEIARTRKTNGLRRTERMQMMPLLCTLNVAVPGKMLALQMLVMVGCWGIRAEFKGGWRKLCTCREINTQERETARQTREKTLAGSSNTGRLVFSDTFVISQLREAVLGKGVALPPRSSSIVEKFPSVPRFLSTSVCPHTLCVIIIKKKRDSKKVALMASW